MKLLSITTIAILLAVAYILNTVWVMYELWNPKPCDMKNKKGNTCLMPYLPKDAQWNLKIFCSSYKRISIYPEKNLIFDLSDIDLTEEVEKSVSVPIPATVRNNGSLYIHAIVHLGGKSLDGEYSVKRSASITQYMKPLTYFKLMGEGDEGKGNSSNGQPVTHWRRKINIHVMQPPFNFDRMNFPGEIIKYLKETRKGKYLPILFIDELGFKTSDLEEITKETLNATLHISFSPISLGKLRLWNTLLESMKKMRELGFTEEDTEQIKGIFTNTNIWLLSLTFFVSTFHLLFEFLAFKHDVSYWNERKTMEGLSFNTVIYRCVSTIIIFFYLMEEQTSLIVLVPAGIGSVIEIWKVTKALKVSVSRSGWRPSFKFGVASGTERQTQKYDQQAIKYLSYVLYPLCIGGAIYSLFYVPHKSWYSWLIKSLVNGVYAFGFLFMLPQLFINYKLKSVAHLPWKAFTYKAFNTFIDDVFAFIIVMPTSHRIACFRDDVVFFCYLYQRWLYPVDKTRANEYGIVYDEDKKDK